MEVISIIVPVYNVELFLPRCVDSLINQTYQNIEIILVDDGSPDKCGDICDRYSKVDKRVKVIHKPNGGLSDARNVAIDIAIGDYLLFVDSDDWIERDTCEKIVKHLISQEADIVVFGIKYVYESGKKETFLKAEECKMINSSTGIGCIINYSGGIGNYACNKAYNKELFKKIRYPKGKVYEDNGTTYKLFHEAHKIYVTNEILYNYYIRGGSISDNRYNPKGFVDRLELWTERLEFLKLHYPEHVNAQMALMVGDMHIGMIKLKGSSSYNSIKEYYHFFVDKYRPSIRLLSGYNRKIWLYYWFRPVFWIYVKCFMKL